MTFLHTPWLGFCCYQFAGGVTILRIFCYPNKFVTAKPANFQLILKLAVTSCMISTPLLSCSTIYVRQNKEVIEDVGSIHYMSPTHKIMWLNYSICNQFLCIALTTSTPFNSTVTVQNIVGEGGAERISICMSWMLTNTLRPSEAFILY